MKIYICGDSFCTSDPEYGKSWVDLLTDNLAGRATVINLAKPASSNLYISLQVDHAIAQQADFIICCGTSVTRNEVVVGTPSNSPLLHRFQNEELISYSMLSVPKHYEFTNNQLQTLKAYHTEFFDLSLAIYMNQDHFSKVNLWDYEITSAVRPTYHIVDADVHQHVATYYTDMILK
jgi:hypothetical protein